MSESAALGLTLIFVSALLMVRNELVYRARIRRIDAIHALNLSQIDRRDLGALIDRRYAEVNERSYVGDLLDLRRWTYRQFFPQEVE